MAAKFLDHNNGSLSYDASDGKENWKKSIGLYQHNNNCARASRFFVRFLAVVARLRRETSKFHAPALRSRRAQRKNFLFLFLNLDTVLPDLTPENFAIIWQIKWNWIRSSKFETVRIHFLSDIFGLLSSRNFATMATWRNDFSTLLDFQLVLCVLNKRQNGQNIWCISLSTPHGTCFRTCTGRKGSNPDKEK